MENLERAVTCIEQIAFVEMAGERRRGQTEAAQLIAGMGQGGDQLGAEPGSGAAAVIFRRGIVYRFAAVPRRAFRLALQLRA